MLILNGGEPPGLRRRPVPGVDRPSCESQKRAEETHLHHRAQQGCPCGRRGGGHNRAPEADRRAEQGRLHQRISRIVGKGEGVGSRRMPGPQHYGMNDRPHREAPGPAGQCKDDERRRYRYQQHVVHGPCAEQRRG